MYILLKTGFSTVLKLTYIQESLKMHGIYAERQCSTRILYAACSDHTEISLQFFLHFKIVYILLNSNFYRPEWS